MGAIDRNIIIKNKSNLRINEYPIENDGGEAGRIKTKDNKYGQ